MVNIKSINIVFCAGLLALMSTLALADDLVPPPWQRGIPGSTYQEWDFPNNNIPQQANPGFINPYGGPNNPPIQTDGYGDVVWRAEFEGRSGVWCLGGDSMIQFQIPNVKDDTMDKIVWSQVTWWAEPGLNQVSLTPFGLGDAELVRVVGTMELGGGWHHSTFEFHLDGCPGLEYYQIINPTTTPMYVDQLVVDTNCVPEPATLLVLGSSVAVVLRRRRK